jgi:hypothetical protein
MANIGGMATFKDRIGIVNDAIRTIAPQIDLLMIYCNDTESYDALTQLPSNVKKYSGENITDRGKFYFCYSLVGSDNIYFTFDDDLIYPTDYVDRTKSGVHMHNCIVGHHGKRFMGDKIISTYTKPTPEEHKFHVAFDWGNKLDLNVDVIGSGCMAFDLRYFCPEELKENLMADIEICCMAKKLNLKMVALSHPHKWIQQNIKMQNKWSIYEHFITNIDVKQTEMVNQYFYNDYKSLAPTV